MKQKGVRKSPSNSAHISNPKSEKKGNRARKQAVKIYQVEEQTDEQPTVSK